MTADAPVALVDLAAQRERLGPALDDAIRRVLEHGRFIMGPEVAELEERLAAYCGARHAIGCASGTDALLLALLAWDVGPGDAVFVPGFTFAATAEVVALLGATPVLVDVDPVSCNLDVARLREAVAAVPDASGLRAAGVIAVDLFGVPADYDSIEAVAADHGMWVLADAAQSFGASMHGRAPGTLGTVAATSFFPTKPLGCYGDGGAVFTADDDLAASIRSLRVHGQGSHAYDHVHIGITGRLDTLQAAVLLVKLPLLDEELAARRRLATRYSAELADVVGVPSVGQGATSAWAQYTVQTDRRDEVGARLREWGVPTAVHYPRALSQQPAYRRFPVAPGGVPVAEALARRVLSLPLHPYLTEAAQQRVIDSVRRAVKELGDGGG
jgi:dTDP-4-amino-4,6-dideoxygalactose transaminase